MRIGAKGLAAADDAFAPRQVHAAMGATHHVLASFMFWHVIRLNHAASAFDEAENNPGAQSKKYQFDQHHAAPENEVHQGSRFGYEMVGVRGFEPPASTSRTCSRAFYLPAQKLIIHKNQDIIMQQRATTCNPKQCFLAQDWRTKTVHLHSVGRNRPEGYR